MALRKVGLVVGLVGGKRREHLTHMQPLKDMGLKHTLPGYSEGTHELHA